ncbi:hypothetical protein BJX62DRAFT_248178 [Aspergillus germanicus]
MTLKVALITGGASGMGLAVARALSALPNWDIHILDINSERGSQEALALARTTFHYADVTKYNTLSEAFRKTFERHKRLDFVFANAGMIERFNFYDPCPAQTENITPPPEPDLLSIDADLKGVILTTYLAQHYFRASPDQGRGASIILTASCGGLYPSYYSPLYSSAKFGVVGFMRSIAQHFKARGVRANAICPGIVRTNLVDTKGWSAFPQHRFTEMDSVVRVVLQLAGVSGDKGTGHANGNGEVSGLTDATGIHLRTERLFGLAVEISDIGVYFREQHAFCDEGMREVMEATVLENQVGAILDI